MDVPPAFTLPAIAAFLRAGGSAVAIAEAALARIAAFDDPALFITPVARERLLAAAASLPAGPLRGVPFVVKDNIDVAGMPTTAGCPAFAYTPDEDAPCVARLRAAGALLLGKANLDQFATGLVGARSPYGVPRNAVRADLVPGGSSSGSATAVASGIAAFALGTDTAGSGRVPAMAQNIVGLKPSLGLVPTRGVVPACRSLDCVSVFALTVADAAVVLEAIAGADAHDPYSRAAPLGWRAGGGAVAPSPRVAVPAQRVFDRDDAAVLFDGVAARLGATVVDIAPFLDVARRLYDGAWVAERTAALRGVAADAMHPVTRAIVAGGFERRTVDAFDDFHAVAQARLAARALFAAHDALLVPTAPGVPTLAALAAEPIAANSRLGTYTNFCNLLDLAAVAVPAGFLGDGAPFGVTLLGPAFSEARLCAIAATLHAGQLLGGLDAVAPAPAPPAPVAADEAALFCIGAHMAGLPLNGQVTSLGGRFVRVASTAPAYRLFALGNRPGLVRGGDGAIAGEVWALPKASIGALLAQVPAPLGFGTVVLEDGPCLGFLAESAGVEGAPEITALGGWRAYLASRPG